MLAETLFTITMYATGCDTKPGHPTKSGTQPVVDFTAAADPKVLPLGSIVFVEGFGERMIHDVGGKVKGQHIDLFVHDCTHARAWGRRMRNVRVLHVPAKKDVPAKR